MGTPTDTPEFTLENVKTRCGPTPERVCTNFQQHRSECGNT